MTGLFLTRAHLRRDAPATALARLLVPENPADRVVASHRLVWALFADSAERTRDFLWREERPGHFMVLSARPPEDPHRLFELESQPFAPLLAPGDRLGFTLRANPVIVAAPSARGQRGKRHDVVMDLLHRLPAEDRAAARPALIVSAGRAWLARQGQGHGFTPRGDEAVDGYDSVSIPRAGGRPAVFGVLDLSGVLEVTDPAAFLLRLAQGFGRARAFGCGLMLIRRAAL
ncbi:MAG: type I-E CRISPR-associated protein Cas6/Cse3/CasE [Azospirillaceae bacterium]|nr:type I-E CRISPR-associated protein Cas6/Cse3/CasE [Azospirillaceae bacterium]